MTTPINKVDPKLNLPATYTIVRIFYRQGEGDGWGLCWSLGYWDGSRWNRLVQPRADQPEYFTGTDQRRVEGWSEISHGLSVSDSLELAVST